MIFRVVQPVPLLPQMMRVNRAFVGYLDYHSADYHRQHKRQDEGVVPRHFEYYQYR